MNSSFKPQIHNDIPQITPFAPPHGLGFWRPEDVRDQLQESLLTLANLPFPPNTRPSGFKSSWPSFMPNLSEGSGCDSSASVNRIIPSAAEISRMEKSLPDWLLLIIDINERKALYLRCSLMRQSDRFYSTRAVGRILGVSHQTVKNWERNGLERIAAELNRRLAQKPTSQNW